MTSAECQQSLSYMLNCYLFLAHLFLFTFFFTRGTAETYILYFLMRFGTAEQIPPLLFFCQSDLSFQASTPYSLESESLRVDCIMSGGASPTLAINAVTNKVGRQ